MKIPFHPGKTAISAKRERQVSPDCRDEPETFAMIDWHRLFGIALTDFFTDSDYEVDMEKDLSLKQQYLDIVIIERAGGVSRPLPVPMPDGLDDLSGHNLITYKSRREPLDDWALDELTGHYVNYRKQISPALDDLLPAEDFRLYAVTTHHPHKLGKKIKLEEVRKGVFEVQWGIRRIRIVVLNRIEEEKHNAIWTLFSSSQKKFRHGAVHYHWRRKTASTIINQLYAFYQSEGIAMPYTMDDYVRDTRREMLESVTVEEMLKMFSID
ncbi:MAG: hypothetical protein GY862_24245, partial [Gammaproteobacteria bacterium]|nr:hypothetical protein [Gammaproteobacteria bacterium]